MKAADDGVERVDAGERSGVRNEVDDFGGAAASQDGQSVARVEDDCLVVMDQRIGFQLP
jgi:hypothetical protein